MEKFIKLKSIPAHIPLMNIDTDMIIPKQFLKTIKRTGLGKSLFYEMRYDENGKKISDFILNKEPYNKSKILLAGKNFGCGSSREHAVWALKDFGFRVIIAPSFADIFFSNCFKNGVLPIILDITQVEKLLKVQDSVELDLNSQKITFGNESITFEIDSHRKIRLLEGLDDIDLTLKENKNIENFENNSNIISIF